MRKKRLFQVFGSTVHKTQARVKPKNEEPCRAYRKKEKVEVDMDKLLSIGYIKKHIMRHKLSMKSEYEIQNASIIQNTQFSTKIPSQKILFVRKLFIDNLV